MRSVEGLHQYYIKDKSVNENEISELTQKESERVKLYTRVIKS